MKIQYFDVSNKIIFGLEALENALLRFKTQSLANHKGDPLMKQPELPMSNAYFTLSFCHEHRTQDTNARLV
jgi:hypothetical protein